MSMLESKCYEVSITKHSEGWIVGASVWGDNREAFTFFFPIVCGLLNRLGARVLWAAILVEWSNLILKWVFKGDRPYWWVGESSLFCDELRPQLRQFPNTCESGPGTPSGHIMMNVALFYVIARGVSTHFIWNSKRSCCVKLSLSLMLFTIYVTWIGVIFVSRLYLLSHFIHQCILGVVVGLFIGHFCWSSHFPVQFSLSKAIKIPILLLGSSLGTYTTLLSQGLNPLWSVPLALQHCARTEYVKVDTQPYFLIVRFVAAALGLGLGLSYTHNSSHENSYPSLICTILGVKGGLLLGRLASMIQNVIPTSDMTTYLSLCFALHTTLPFLVVYQLPRFLSSVFGSGRNKLIN